jgi:hypothetical protein
MKLHEYQRKGLTRKAGAGSRTPNVVNYSVKYTQNYRKVKEKAAANLWG